MGGWFHKIGVGLLKKEDSEYFFMKKYEIQPANFKVNVDSENIHSTCESKLHNGYSYLLVKEIRLLVNGFIIKYYLKNTGKKTIITNEYVHNFMSINKALIGEDYELILNFNKIVSLSDDLLEVKNLVKDLIDSSIVRVKGGIIYEGEHVWAKSVEEFELFLADPKNTEAYDAFKDKYANKMRINSL
mgnify:CR=1 FL=1